MNDVAMNRPLFHFGRLQSAPLRLLCASVLGGVLATGCASWQPPQAQLPSLEVSSAWQGGAAVVATDTLTPPQSPAQIQRWWQSMGDATLQQLVEQALQHNIGMRNAYLAVEQARASRDAQAAGLLPNVGASASAQRSQSAGSAQSSLGAGLDASWEVDLFGRLRSGLAASDAEWAASEATLYGTQVSLVAEVATRYIELRSLERRLGVAQANLKNQQETLQIAQWRLQAGLVTSLVTEQALASVEQTAAQVPALQSSIAQARHALAVLTGQAPTALDAVLSTSSAVTQPSQDWVLAIPADTLRQRPDVQVAQARVQAAQARVSQAEAARMPSLRLSGALTLRGATLAALTGGGSAFAASLASGLSMPLFDGGALKAQLRGQELALEQARNNYVSTVLTALQEVEGALVAIASDQERLQRLGVAAQAAENADLIAQQRFASGLIDFQTVLDTQRTRLNMQDSVATAQASLSSNHVRLFKAMGGGWEPIPALREPASTP